MVPLLAIVAWSGTGKTTLLKQLIPLLKAKGIRPGLIKHTHHDMDVDKPGKDSYELRKAGADQVLVASQQRWALMTETPFGEEPNLAWLASRMDVTKLDLVLVEGFKGEAVPKIVLWREGLARSVDELLDSSVIAVASDNHLMSALPVLDLNHPSCIAEFIVAWLEQIRSQPVS
ncbi:molybdopterin-guanine dinucleotide biosynthesis adapter protein [Paramixta manurensis]|uniref:Molybdopterin-guanine dinucleotide biosynthesis adapter protein n=1 Tax=Paramixta manurensis TaxID=2740817 RepID=A0A6M8UMS6_9GAMM|nr:molybdopterin-guanine dinucleotide biosynthesis adapter protein [Erwiniaceae bacterium PD-1]